METTEQTQTVNSTKSSQTKAKEKISIEIVNANIIGYYSYKPDIEIVAYGVKQEASKECVICKKSLLEPSYDTVSDNTNIFNECDVVIGKCGHMFHSDCIGNWLTSSNQCPIDKVEWKIHRIADSVTNLVMEKNRKCNHFHQDKKIFNDARKKYLKNRSEK